MILSKERLNNLLNIFAEQIKIEPYDNTKTKNELENSNNFVNNSSVYGSQSKIIPLTSIKPLDNDKNNNNIFKSSILTKYSNRKQKNIIENPRDKEIRQSLKNLITSMNDYKREQESFNNNIRNLRQAKSDNNIFSQSKFNYSNIYENDQFNDKILSSIYTSNNTIYNSQILLKNNSINIRKSLKEIPSNPNDVAYKVLPSNFNQLMISNTLRNDNMSDKNMNQNIDNINPPIEEDNQPQQRLETEDLYSDVNNNSNNQQIEEQQYVSVEEEKPNQEIKEEVIPRKQGIYKITAFNGPIKLPEGYSTDDVDEYNAIQIINDDISKWKIQIDKPNYKIYSKPFKTRNEKGEEGESRMFYLDATIDRPASVINKAINSFELRQEWEESLKKGKKIREKNLEKGVKIIDYYAYIKMPIIFSDRDIVVRKKIWENYNGEKDCCLNEIHSIELQEFPAKKKPVRARLENKSKYIKPIDENKSRFIYVNKFDMKISLGSSMMESKGAEGTEKWFKQFLKHL